MSQRRGVDDADGLTSVDLLEEIRAALDGLEPLLLGRIVDIEMPRLRVLTDPTLCRRLLAELVGYAVAHSEPPDSITVRVARAGKAARIEVLSEGGHAIGDDLLDLTSGAKELRAVGGEIGTEGPVGSVVSWMTLPRHLVPQALPTPDPGQTDEVVPSPDGPLTTRTGAARRSTLVSW